MPTVENAAQVRLAADGLLRERRIHEARAFVAVRDGWRAAEVRLLAQDDEHLLAKEARMADEEVRARRGEPHDNEQGQQQDGAGRARGAHTHQHESDDERERQSHEHRAHGPAENLIAQRVGVENDRQLVGIEKHDWTRGAKSHQRGDGQPGSPWRTLRRRLRTSLHSGA